MLKRMIISVLAAGLLTAFAEDAGTAKKPSLAEGKKIFKTNCAICHGEKGKGDGAAGAALNPKPRNFTDTAFMTKEPTEKLYSVIAEGGKKNGYSAMMAPWKGVLKKDGQIEDVLAYVLTFSSDSAKAVNRVMEKGKKAEAKK
ncbi:MAG TPA: hypothetical protein DCQ83_07980 [Fibrobacteres bacterium]|jgi:mono/diheme cytochrome c family protein|nr:hypothetical protein [Fibrobacterota bacterium]